MALITWASTFDAIAMTTASARSEIRAAFISVVPAEEPQNREHAPMAFGGFFDVEFRHDVADVRLDRPQAEVQVGGDADVGLALGHQPDDIALARGERVG